MSLYYTCILLGFKDWAVYRVFRSERSASLTDYTNWSILALYNSYISRMVGQWQTQHTHTLSQVVSQWNWTWRQYRTPCISTTEPRPLLSLLDPLQPQMAVPDYQSFPHALLNRRLSVTNHAIYWMVETLIQRKLCNGFTNASSTCLPCPVLLLQYVLQ